MSGDLPPGTLFVRHMIKTHGRIERSVLIEATNLAEATVDRAIDRLLDDGVISKCDHLTDRRRVVYRFEE